jgi:predicted ribosome quality control (RQC) complex YloA/Tae2 family protein
MANKKGMSGLDLRAFISEFSAVLPLWIGKSYQYDSSFFGIRINGEGKSKYQLFIETGVRMHLSGELPPAPKNPSGYSMVIRKYLNGGRILAVSQPGIERIVDFEVGKSERRYHLIFEMFDEGNIIICDEEYRIIQPFRRHRFRDRDVVAGERYTLAGPGAADIPDAERMKEAFLASETDLVRTLATKMMLGGRYAEEVCRIAEVEKSIPATEAKAETIYPAYIALINRAESDTDPCITRTGCWPFPIGNEVIIARYATFNEALDTYYPKYEGEQEKAAKGKEKLTKEEIIRRRQAEAIQSFEKKISAYQAIVDAIYEHYGEVAGIIETLDAASTTTSWQDIEKILASSELPAAKAIVKVFPSEAAVDVVIGEKKIKIYVHESVEANAARYYDLVKKFRKKRTGALAAMEKFREQPKKKKTAEFHPMKKAWYHRFRWCYTSDNVLMIGGKDAGTNEEIVKKYLQGGDYFVHADVHGGSVVIVKGETAHWDEVAQFAASYSNAWKAGHFTADVYAAEQHQVSKTPESGEYVARGSFVVRGERRYFRDTPLGIAIGLQTAPELGVIGGPVTAVKAHAKHYIVLAPGTFEPNDIAKKVLKRLREQFPDDWKSIKTVLNAESVMAFVPPGGSDIMEEQ